MYTVEETSTKRTLENESGSIYRKFVAILLLVVFLSRMHQENSRLTGSIELATILGDQLYED